MEAKDTAQKWASPVNKVTIGATGEQGGTRGKTVTIGGSHCVPWMGYEGPVGCRPAIAIEVWDGGADSWPAELRKQYGDAMNDPIAWAKKGIFSYSYAPLNMLSFFGTALFLVTVLLGALQTISKLLFPEATPWGITTVLLGILFFGSVNLFALSLIGEYIAKIFEEVKQRPHFIRRTIVRDGEVRPASAALQFEQ